MRGVSMVIVLALATACGGDVETGAMDDGTAPLDETVAETAPATSSPVTDGAGEGLLCDRIEDDEALTPNGAERLEVPGLAEANSERRCIFAFGVDMAIDDVRRFYRSTLPGRGYEMVRDEEMEGIVTGNLSRTFIRATKTDLQTNVQIDEFDPEAGLSEHRVNVKLQFDAMRR